jgi:hypothetical protein
MSNPGISYLRNLGIQAALIACVLSACKGQEDKQAENSPSINVSKEASNKPHYISTCVDSGEVAIKDSTNNKTVITYKETCDSSTNNKFLDMKIFPLKGDTLAIITTTSEYQGNYGCEGGYLEYSWLLSRPALSHPFNPMLFSPA